MIHIIFILVVIDLYYLKKRRLNTMILIIFKKDSSPYILLCWIIIFKFLVYGLVCQYMLKACYVSYKKSEWEFHFWGVNNWV